MTESLQEPVAWMDGRGRLFYTDDPYYKDNHDGMTPVFPHPSDAAAQITELNKLCNYHEKVMDIQGKDLILRDQQIQRLVAENIKLDNELNRCSVAIINAGNRETDWKKQIAELENLLKGVEAGFECATSEVERLRKELAGFSNVHDMWQCMIETADENNRLMKHVDNLVSAGVDQERRIANLATELDKYRNAIGIVADICNSAMKGIQE